MVVKMVVRGGEGAIEWPMDATFMAASDGKCGRGRC